MFKLSPWDAGRDPFDMAHWGLQDVLQVDSPYVEDVSGNKKLNLKFDCSRFKPEEITVKAIDRNLTVHAKHEESGPDKRMYREFTRSYVLPENVDPSKLTSSLSSDGVLCIERRPRRMSRPEEKGLSQRSTWPSNSDFTF